MGCGLQREGFLLSTPCLPTSRNDEWQHSADSQTGTKALEKWPNGFSHRLNSGGKPGVSVGLQRGYIHKGLLTLSLSSLPKNSPREVGLEMWLSS